MTYAKQKPIDLYIPYFNGSYDLGDVLLLSSKRVTAFWSLPNFFTDTLDDEEGKELDAYSFRIRSLLDSLPANTDYQFIRYDEDTSSDVFAENAEKMHRYKKNELLNNVFFSRVQKWRQTESSTPSLLLSASFDVEHIESVSLLKRFKNAFMKRGG